MRDYGPEARSRRRKLIVWKQRVRIVVAEVYWLFVVEWCFAERRCEMGPETRFVVAMVEMV